MVFFCCPSIGRSRSDSSVVTLEPHVLGWPVPAGAGSESVMFALWQSPRNGSHEPPICLLGCGPMPCSKRFQTKRNWLLE